MNCLVTRLKEKVDNANLPYFDSLEIEYVGSTPPANEAQCRITIDSDSNMILSSIGSHNLYASFDSTNIVDKIYGTGTINAFVKSNGDKVRITGIGNLSSLSVGFYHVKSKDVKLPCATKVVIPYFEGVLEDMYIPNANMISCTYCLNYASGNANRLIENMIAQGREHSDFIHLTLDNNKISVNESKGLGMTVSFTAQIISPTQYKIGRGNDLTQAVTWNKVGNTWVRQ